MRRSNDRDQDGRNDGSSETSGRVETVRDPRILFGVGGGDKECLEIEGDCDVVEEFETPKKGSMRELNHYVNKEAAKWIMDDSKKGVGMDIKSEIIETKNAVEKMSTFGHAEFGDLRVMNEGSQTWFVGNDVAKMLGYSNSRDALAKHVFTKNKRDDVAIRDTIGRDQKTTLINEAGMYQLILKSKLPKAEKFQDWVTSEVLPSIRRTAGYEIPKTTEDFLKQAISHIQSLDERVKILEPKAEDYDRFLNSEGLFYIKDVAKACGWKQNEFFELLKIKKIIHWIGDHYQSCYGHDEHFKLISTQSSRDGKIYKTLMVTPKGYAYLFRRFDQKKAIAGVVKKIQKEVTNG